MDLYFLRHGEADWPDWEKTDDERPLTKRGKKEMHKVASFLKRVKARPDLIVTSPLPRASQTAEIAAEHLKVECREDKLLAPGFSQRGCGLVLPIFQPARDPGAEIARTLGEKMFGQFRRTALQILLTHFNYGQQFVALAFPF